jgi:hypothetical protein
MRLCEEAVIEPERVLTRARGGRRWRERLVEHVDGERVV